MSKYTSIDKTRITARQILSILLFLESLLIAIAIAKALNRDLSPAHYFGEGRLITDVSCVQLLIAAVLSLITFWCVKFSSNPELKTNGWFWLIVSFGLLFLAFDDAYEIHEYIDLWLHSVFNVQQTDLTDLADDLIVGGYMLVFLAYVAFKWNTIQIFKSSFSFFKIGFILTAVMVVLDILSNNDYFVSLIIDDATVAKLTEQWLSVLEDSAKIYAEGLFIAGIYKCWHTARAIKIFCDR